MDERAPCYAMGTAGRCETDMLLPVVFLMLPVVVLFALYPGLFTLSQLAR